MFRVPGQWTTFDQTALYRDQFPNSSFESARNATSGSWTVAFDASPTPSIKDLLGLTAYPTGFAKSRPATAAERTSLKTPAGLRNAVIPIDQQQKSNPDLVHVISSQNLKLSGGYRGVRVVFTIQEDPTAPGLEINQTAIVDPGIQNLYLLVIGCDQTCYANSGPAIQQVVGSWTVKES
ncbi:MAG TPA: hypothetical protein VGH10_11545 [Actinomycetota bacterium]